jgi:hypothetical protein
MNTLETLRHHLLGINLRRWSAPNMRTTVTDSTTAVTGSASLSRKRGRASMEAAFHRTNVLRR